ADPIFMSARTASGLSVAPPAADAGAGDAASGLALSGAAADPLLPPHAARARPAQPRQAPCSRVLRSRALTRGASQSTRPWRPSRQFVPAAPSLLTRPASPA